MGLGTCIPDRFPHTAVYLLGRSMKPVPVTYSSLVANSIITYINRANDTVGPIVTVMNTYIYTHTLPGTMSKDLNKERILT